MQLAKAEFTVIKRTYVKFCSMVQFLKQETMEQGVMSFCSHKKYGGCNFAANFVFDADIELMKSETEIIPS